MGEPAYPLSLSFSNIREIHSTFCSVQSLTREVGNVMISKNIIHRENYVTSQRYGHIRKINEQKITTEI